MDQILRLVRQTGGQSVAAGADVRVERLHARRVSIRFEGRAAGEELEDRHADGPNVHFETVRAVFQHLRRLQAAISNNQTEREDEPSSRVFRSRSSACSK